MHVMERDHTEQRITELNEKVDWGFEQVDKRFERVEARLDKIDERFETVTNEFVAVRREMKEGFEKQDLRFDSLQRANLMTLVTLSGCMITGFASVIAAQIWA